MSPETRPSSVWQGDRVRRRPVEPDDWAVFSAWNRDEELARLLYHVPFPQSREALRRWTEQEAIRTPDDDAFRWLIEDRGGSVVGSISTHDCDRRHGAFGYGVHMQGEHRRRGYASDAILAVLHSSFDELGYAGAHVHAYAFNAASIALHERLGFLLEGRLRRMRFSAGRHHDVPVYGQTVGEFAERNGRGQERSEPRARSGPQ